MTVSNLFADLPAHLPAELFTTLLDAAGVRIERIVFWCVVVLHVVVVGTVAYVFFGNPMQYATSHR